MKRIQKTFVGATILGLLAVGSGVPFVQAQGILPGGEGGSEQCRKMLESDNQLVTRAFENKDGLNKYMQTFSGVLSKRDGLSRILGCALQSGKIRLFMIPFFITYLIQFLLQIAGLIAVLFVVYGGFQYVKGGVSEDKDSGKKTLTHALIGLVVALSAWMIVNFIQVALTS